MERNFTTFTLLALFSLRTRSACAGSKIPVKHFKGFYVSRPRNLKLRGGMPTTTDKFETNTIGRNKTSSLSEKLALLKHLDSRKLSRQADVEVEICGLPTMLGKQVLVLMTDGKNLYGILESFDRNTNIILRNVTERVFPEFEISEDSGQLAKPVIWQAGSEGCVDWIHASGEIWLRTMQHSMQNKETESL